jgi:hypothetical protein
MDSPTFETVTISFADGVTSVDKPVVRLYYDSPDGPDSIRWKVASKPQATARVKILWDTAGPFGQVRNANGDIDGTGNLKKQGSYHYAVLFVDAKGQVLGGVDPDIINDPRP